MKKCVPDGGNCRASPTLGHPYFLWGSGRRNPELGFSYRHTVFYCPSLYCASQMLHFLTNWRQGPPPSSTVRGVEDTKIICPYPSGSPEPWGHSHNVNRLSTIPTSQSVRLEEKQSEQVRMRRSVQTCGYKSTQVQADKKVMALLTSSRWSGTKPGNSEVCLDFSVLRPGEDLGLQPCSVCALHLDSLRDSRDWTPPGKHRKVA